MTRLTFSEDTRVPANVTFREGTCAPVADGESAV
jgi:hypothetical protein